MSGWASALGLSANGTHQSAIGQERTFVIHPIFWQDAQLNSAINWRTTLHFPYVFSLLLVCTANAFAAPSIQPLLESEAQSGCGCNFQLQHGKGERTFLQWLEGEKASMRIDNQLERLTVMQTGARSKRADEISVGDTNTYVLQNGRITALLSTQVIQACTPDNSECESVGLKAVINVKTRKGSAFLDARGACGC
jgi:hypothetical protein